LSTARSSLFTDRLTFCVTGRFRTPYSQVPLNWEDAPMHVSVPQQSKSDAHDLPWVMVGSRQSRHVPLPSCALQYPSQQSPPWHASPYALHAVEHVPRNELGLVRKSQSPAQQSLS
jgi:hypothetical protein